MPFGLWVRVPPFAPMSKETRKQRILRERKALRQHFSKFRNPLVETPENKHLLEKVVKDFSNPNKQ